MCLVDTEKEQRRRFLRENGRILPNEFIPQLKNLPPSIHLENPDADKDLPDLKKSPKNENAPVAQDKENWNKSYTVELEKLNQQYKAEIIKMKEDSEYKSLKRKLDGILKEFETEKEKNRALKLKINDMERRNGSGDHGLHLKKDASNPGSDYEQMKSEFDQITKLAINSLTQLENQENIIPNKENAKAQSKLDKATSGQYKDPLNS